MGWFLPIAAAIGSKLIGGATGKKQEQSQITRYARPQYVNPEQQTLLSQMLRQYAGGGGEFGFGPAARQGQATLSAALAGRGISAGSGVSSSAMAQMIAAAMAQDADARRRYGLNLLSVRPQTYTPWTSGLGVAKQPGSLWRGIAQGLDTFAGWKFGQQAGWY